MLNITQFNLDKNAQQLQVTLANDANSESASNNVWVFNYEYLRVASLHGFSVKQPAPSHKKHIQLVSIEAVAKHGYRFIFDDGFQTIYSIDELNYLQRHADKLWQDYLAALAETGHNREASIDIKQL